MDAKNKLLQLCSQQKSKFKQFRQKGEANAEKIFHTLKTYSNHEISRYTIVGGIGKPTFRKVNTNQSDFDLVIFISGEKHPFTPVLADFCRVLEQKYNKNKKKTSNKTVIIEKESSHSVQFRIKDLTKLNEVDSPEFLSFSILPAINLILKEEEGNLDEEEIIKLQSKRSRKLIFQISPFDRKLSCYKNSFAEEYVQFVKNQSRFVKKLIRLGQMWNRMVSWEGHDQMYARSKLIELVAISVGQTEQKDALNDSRDESILLAFQCFLKKFIYFDKNMQELFEDGTTEDKNFKAKRYKTNASNMTKAIVVDPVNKFNNVADHMRTEMKWAFQSQARTALKSIHRFMRYKGRYHFVEGEFGL